MRKLKPIIAKKVYERLLQRTLVDFLDGMIFEGLEAIFSESLLNETSVINDALLKGRIYYENGVFTGKFSNILSSHLETMGAKWSSRKHGYVLPLEKIPTELQQTIARLHIKTEQLVKDALLFLSDVENQKAYIYSKLDITHDVGEIQKDLFGQLNNTLRGVNSIKYDMNKYKGEQIEQNYTNNVQQGIKGFADKELNKLRTNLQKLLIAGATPNDLKQYLEDEQGFSRRRAGFIARNETMLFVSNYQQARMQENGINQYLWQTNLDGRERPEHRALDNKIFTWDNPPLIDQRTGTYGHPGQFYGCRCIAVPVINDYFGRNLQKT